MSIAATSAGGGGAYPWKRIPGGRMTTRIFHDHFLMRLDDQEPCTDGKQYDDGDDGND
jgi:hypothetical protein